MNLKENRAALYKTFMQRWKSQNQSKYMTYLISEAISWTFLIFVLVLGLVTEKEGVSAGLFILLCFSFIIAVASGIVGFMIRRERMKEWQQFFLNKMKHKLESDNSI